MRGLHIPDELRRPLAWVGYPVFALVAFITALFLTLPRDRIKERIEAAASQQLGMDVTIGDLGLSLLTGAGVQAQSVTIRTRPVLPDEKPVRWFVDDLSLKAGLLAAMSKHADVAFTGHLAGGTLDGELRSSPEETALKLDLEAVALKDAPMVSGKIPVPVDGALSTNIDVTVPKNIAPQAIGQVKADVEHLVLGDGKAQLKVPGVPMLDAGITFPKIALGHFGGTVVVDKGRATLKDFRGHSPDADLEIDGYLELRDPIDRSLWHLYVRFHPTDALAKREPMIELLNQMVGPMARRPDDGYLGFSVTGPFGSPLPMPSLTPPIGVTLGKAQPVAPARPSLPTPPLALPRTPLPTVNTMPSPGPTPPPSTPTPPPPPGQLGGDVQPAGTPAPGYEPPTPPPAPPMGAGSTTTLSMPPAARLLPALRGEAPSVAPPPPAPGIGLPPSMGSAGIPGGTPPPPTPPPGQTPEDQTGP